MREYARAENLKTVFVFLIAIIVPPSIGKDCINFREFREFCGHRFRQKLVKVNKLL